MEVLLGLILLLPHFTFMEELMASVHRQLFYGALMSEISFGHTLEGRL